MSKTEAGSECDRLQKERNVVSKGDKLSFLLLEFFLLRRTHPEELGFFASHYP